MADTKREHRRQGMSTEEAGRKGGQATAETHGREFYQSIGQKGGQASGGNFKNDPERAARAGQKGGQVSGGNFKNNRERAAQAGHKGGQASGGNFKNNPARAAEAGRKGGERSHGGGRAPGSDAPLPGSSGGHQGCQRKKPGSSPGFLSYRPCGVSHRQSRSSRDNSSQISSGRSARAVSSNTAAI